MDKSNTHSNAIFLRAILYMKLMQKSRLVGKYLTGSNYSPKTTSYVINNKLSDYLEKSKHSTVLQTALYQQNYVTF